MIFNKLLLILYLSIFTFANGVYNINLLDFQAKVFPKIIIADNNLENKLINNKILLTILYDDIDLNSAQILKEMLEKNYITLKDFTFEVNLIRYNDFISSNISTAYFFLLGKKDKIVQITELLSKNGRLSFTYDDSYLDFGVIFGLKISSKVNIFLKLQNLKDSGIELQNSIFNVVILK
ncbi:hypothetical protein [Aliarcobacter vitoriensis]|uniref:YfiR family protein n=1 Tax=Aliarcobacter vitoriensis TaxID=2011099 RepID=A0A366MSY2_9BACT|nr:hypothetical protein [Aliarcobacter vitoriensis]RBQ29376.1 hypothetical protein CRU91_04645 [Aliarcobacter vitoriensis]RBQ31516.1 hypothetical protein CRU92_07005 [Arcobacter sp. FW59]